MTGENRRQKIKSNIQFLIKKYQVFFKKKFFSVCLLPIQAVEQKVASLAAVVTANSANIYPASYRVHAEIHSMTKGEKWICVVLRNGCSLVYSSSSFYPFAVANLPPKLALENERTEKFAIACCCCTCKKGRGLLHAPPPPPLHFMY